MLPTVRLRLPDAAAAALCCAHLFAQSLPVVSRPEEVGFSSERLEKTRGVLKADVESERLPGAVLLIAREGKVAFYDSAGFQERASKTPMRKDSIFRIASMSKPITTVAAMILAEDNKLDVAAPVAQYLPEFSDVKVGPEGVAPKRPITVQDLMRHTSGLTYGIFGNSPVDHMYRKADIFHAKSLEQMVKAIARLPLLHQPGEYWEYSVSTDVLGQVVEVASGMDLDNFVRERITRPLKMNDTGFSVKPERFQRLARPDGEQNAAFADETQKPAVLSGGGGMLSTAMDYARFCQMFLNGGELDGVRLLAPKTVALMTSDQLPPCGPAPHTSGAGAGRVRSGSGNGHELRAGLRDSYRRRPQSIAGFTRRLFLGGGITGTLFWVDPQAGSLAVLMAQTPRPNLHMIWRQLREPWSIRR